MNSGCTNSPCRAEFINGGRNGLQIGRADVGAIGVAEIDQQQFATKIGVGTWSAILIDQRKRTADLLLVPHHRVHQGGGRVRCCRRPQQPPAAGGDDAASKREG